jgi:nucleoid-associated protein YgaU
LDGVFAQPEADKKENTMGLFDFVADAGEKLSKAVLGDKAEGAELEGAASVSQERINTLREQNIQRMIAQLDVEGESVTVSVNGEVATLSGRAPSQEALEKIVLCAGNQHGIARVDCQLAVDTPAAAAAPEASAAQEPASTFYTVQKGDTLGKIAQEHYGSASKYPLIFEANRPMLSDPDKIYPGQTLRIPSL